MCRWTILIEECFTGKYDHVFVAGFIGVEIQRHTWMVHNMFDLLRAWLAEDQKRIVFPDKPDGARLRCEIGINSRQPDDIFIFEMSLNYLPEWR